MAFLKDKNYYDEPSDRERKVITRATRIFYCAVLVIFLCNLLYHRAVTGIISNNAKQMRSDLDFRYLAMSNNEFRQAIEHKDRANVIAESIIEDLKKENERLKAGKK